VNTEQGHDKRAERDEHGDGKDRQERANYLNGRGIMSGAQVSDSPGRPSEHVLANPLAK
jgi:hypothetical protein